MTHDEPFKHREYMKNPTTLSLPDMEDSWENWLSHLGMSWNSATVTATAAVVSGLSFEEIVSFDGHYSDSSNGVKQHYSYLKTIQEELASYCSSPLTTKRALGNYESEPKENRVTKKARSSSEALHHIMSERKRRQDIAEKFIALSATIPGLKKTDKASILQEAINYVKQLQQRIAVLEKETNKKSIKSLFINKSHLCSVSCETKSNGYYGAYEVLPEVEARGLGKEVLIRIHCEKRNGILLKLLALLKNIHLSIASSSILPFGNSIFNIIIVAQMSEEYKLTVNDLVKTLKQNLFEVV
ncbi:transcription factor bHLH18-like [Gastrolobium bilobum]|uniref:transcription factor bHLH18-like n=1 Tax=Gastrolobium bilobum TaxID=150636 RepID=UPI002AB27B5B|nr:transcription factor bHLH18-like [Gastrolobium bilobum]